MSESVLSEIMALKALPREALERKYVELFNGERPPSANKMYLWRRVAYRVQEIAYGGLSQEAQGRIRELIQEHDPVNNRAMRPDPEEKPKRTKKTGIRDLRLPIPGTILQKRYKGRDFEVKVLEKGFEYVGIVYPTLSKIAKTITGDHWNGYLFFGLGGGK